MAAVLKKEEWDLVSFRVEPATVHAIAQAMRRQGITSRPEWLTAAVEKALAEQGMIL